jgi:hypothetical protein
VVCADPQNSSEAPPRTVNAARSKIMPMIGPDSGMPDI